MRSQTVLRLRAQPILLACSRAGTAMMASPDDLSCVFLGWPTALETSSWPGPQAWQSEDRGRKQRGQLGNQGGKAASASRGGKDPMTLQWAQLKAKETMVRVKAEVS